MQAMRIATCTRGHLQGQYTIPPPSPRKGEEKKRFGEHKGGRKSDDGRAGVGGTETGSTKRE